MLFKNTQADKIQLKNFKGKLYQWKGWHCFSETSFLMSNFIYNKATRSTERAGAAHEGSLQDLL